MSDFYNLIETLYPAVHEETKPLHRDPKRRKRFFMPKLMHLHHLHPHGSKMLNNPLSIIVSELYEIYSVVRKALSKLARRLFPKNDDLIYGDRVDGTIVGNITFTGRKDAEVPIHHLQLKLWGKTRLGFWRKLGETSTKTDGTFALPYDITAINGLHLRKNLRFEILHSEGYTFNGHVASPDFEIFKTIKVPKSSLVCMRYNLGLIQLFYWEYRQETKMPRVIVKDNETDAPQKYEPGRIDAISEQFIPVELITKKLRKKIDLHPERITPDIIQGFFPESMTLAFDNENPGLSRSDEYFGVRMMNGVYANVLDQWPDDPSTYWVHYHWSSYDHDSSTYIFPDVTCKFKLDESKYLRPTEIILRGKLTTNDPDNIRRSLKPTDGAEWEGAKRIARVQAALSAQLDKHFIGTHSNVEQYAIAVHRNFQRNPIAALYHAHLKGISLINHTADHILINETGYIVRTSAITEKGMKDRFVDVLGTHDWKNYKPQQPISEKHFYARISNLYWDIVNQLVEEFIEIHKDEIIKEWHEVYAFSNDLVKHSVPVYLCNYLGGHRSQNGPQVADWFAKDGRMDLSQDRVNINGELKANCQVTKASDYDPSSNDMENLKQVSAYIIYQGSFGHFWSNFQQYDDIGELAYSTLGLRYSPTDVAAFADEKNESILPDKEICLETMWWANMLSRTGYGFIMHNEAGDIHPRFIELMKEHDEDFQKLYFDIYDLQSRTNI